MERSTSFLIEGWVDTRVTVTERDDGTLLFDLEVLDRDYSIGDLRALFFDLDGIDVDTLSITATGEDITDSAVAEEDVTNLGWGVGVSPLVLHERGAFDMGVEFGTYGWWWDDIQQTSFVLSADQALSLDMLDMSDMALRYAWSSLDVSTAGVARHDEIEADSGATAAFDLLANDSGAQGRTVTAVADETVVGASGDFEVDVIVDGKNYGLLRVGGDGTAVFSADGPDAGSLAFGEAVVFQTGYQTVGADGSTATAGIQISVVGSNTPPIANDDRWQVPEEFDSSFDGLVVMTNDSDQETDLFDLRVVEMNGLAENVGQWVTLQSGALVKLVSTGGFDYQPNGAFDLKPGEIAIDTFEYTVSDGDGGIDTATVTLEVLGAWNPPVDVVTVDFEDVTTKNFEFGFGTHDGFVWGDLGEGTSEVGVFKKELLDGSSSPSFPDFSASSGDYVAALDGSMDVLITSETGEDFDFFGGFFGTGSTEGADAIFEFTGYLDGVVVENATIDIADKQWEFIELEFTDIDQLVISGTKVDSNETALVLMDDMLLV